MALQVCNLAKKQETASTGADGDLVEYTASVSKVFAPGLGLASRDIKLSCVFCARDGH